MLATVSHLVLVAAVLAWLGTIAAVARDARARVRNRSTTRAAAATAFVLPFVGALVWVCVRPTETRLERRERRLRAAVLQQQLGQPLLVAPVVPGSEQASAQAAA